MKSGLLFTLVIGRYGQAKIKIINIKFKWWLCNKTRFEHLFDWFTHSSKYFSLLKLLDCRPYILWFWKYHLYFSFKILWQIIFSSLPCSLVSMCSETVRVHQVRSATCTSAKHLENVQNTVHWSTPGNVCYMYIC